MRKSLALAFASLAAFSAGAQPLSKLADERAAIAAALRDRGLDKASRLVISDRTTTFTCGLSSEELIQVEGCTGMRARDEAIDRALQRLRQRLGASQAAVADLRAKSREAVAVDQAFEWGGEQKLWGPGRGVRRSQLAAPDYAVAFSRVGFDAAKGEALVYVATLSPSDPKRSFGEYLRLERAGGDWKVARRLRVWQLQP